MSIEVLVVDDSPFYLKRLTRVLDGDENIKIVGTATNGLEAVRQAKKLHPDVITMDVEMPTLNGIEATKQIMDEHPTPILMFSALTQEGAAATFDALEAGALDFLPKNKESLHGGVLIDKIINLSKCRLSRERRAARKAEVKPEPAVKEAKEGLDVKLVMIGCSTGGPVALQRILPDFPKDLPVPIVVVQHMPENFTSAFAGRMDKLSKLTVQEAKNREILKPGHVYITPGGFQLGIIASDRNIQAKVDRGDDTEMYKPSVDFAFTSAANTLNNNVLGVILTGMGQDGTVGSKKLKEKGARIWAQDEESSTVFGMPQSVIKEGLASKILSLDDVGRVITRELT